MSKRYIIALDQGTTSSKAFLYDIDKAVITDSSGIEYTQYYPQPGWVEQDPNEIFESQIRSLTNVIHSSKVNPLDIVSLGITNQRETVIVWDKRTSEPICKAIVWQCRRTAEICEDLRNRGYEDFIHKKTGLILDAYFSASKVKWILDNVDGAKEKARNGNLLMGTVDTWLVYKLTKGKLHVTDPSNASRTMLFNINTNMWDDELLSLFEIPRNMLADVVDTSGKIGYIDEAFFGSEILISSIVGDQQSSLFGQNCFSKGDAKNTYGTGCFMLMNIGQELHFSKSKLISTIAWSIDNELTYAIEGSVFNAGSAVQWLRDEMKLIQTSQETSERALSVNDTNGAYFVPAFTGLGAPYWDMHAKGILSGLTRGTNANHVIRAVLESIAYQSKDVLDVIMDDTSMEIKSLRVDGGISNNEFLMQFQSDILNIDIIRPIQTEVTAMGAILLSGLAFGVWKNINELKDNLYSDKIFHPSKDKEWRNLNYMGWCNSVKRSRGDLV